MGNLASTKGERGKLAEAEDMQKEVLVEFGQSGIGASGAGKYEEAEALHRPTLVGREKVL